MSSSLCSDLADHATKDRGDPDRRSRPRMFDPPLFSFMDIVTLGCVHPKWKDFVRKLPFMDKGFGQNLISSKVWSVYKSVYKGSMTAIKGNTSGSRHFPCVEGSRRIR